ncbi:MAG: hypothetical protein M3Y21_01610 [Candidatus Eremiobacteraeota bacterium]|nr:hypothetical protein [Candidatus Eremiobacteraeota bacterium]
MVAKQDVASAIGVAADQVFTPAAPTKNECEWAVAAHTGVPGQRVALTLQTVDRIKQAHGFMQKFSAVLSAAGNIPGLPINNPMLSRIFADSQTIAGLGDKAGWKNSALSVLKNDILFNIEIGGPEANAQRLNIATTLARVVITHLGENGSVPK